MGLLRTGAAVYILRPAAAAAFLRDAVAVTVVVAQGTLVAVLAATQVLAVMVLVVPALLVLVVPVAAAVTVTNFVVLPLLHNKCWRRVALVVVVELGYWEVAQTEPEVWWARRTVPEVWEVEEAAQVLLEAPAQMVAHTKHLLEVLEVYMVPVAVWEDATAYIVAAVW